MDKVIRCDCGFEAFGASDDELVTSAQAHASQAHDVDLAAEVILALAGQSADRRAPAKDDGSVG